MIRSAAAVLVGLVLLSTGAVQRLTSGNDDDDALQLSTAAQVISVDPQRIGARGQPIALRVRDGGAAGPVFVGAARDGDVLAFLDGVAWADVVEPSGGELPARRGGAPADPTVSDIWVAAATGEDATALSWPGAPAAAPSDTASADAGGTQGAKGTPGTAGTWRLVAVGPTSGHGIQVELSWRRPKERRGGLALGVGGMVAAAGALAAILTWRRTREGEPA